MHHRVETIALREKVVKLLAENEELEAKLAGALGAIQEAHDHIVTAPDLYRDDYDAERVETLSNAAGDTCDTLQKALDQRTTPAATRLAAIVRAAEALGEAHAGVKHTWLTTPKDVDVVQQGTKGALHALLEIVVGKEDTFCGTPHVLEVKEHGSAEVVRFRDVTGVPMDDIEEIEKELMEGLDPERYRVMDRIAFPIEG